MFANRKRIIYILAFLAIGTALFFIFKSFSRESKKEISINPRENPTDILSDESFGQGNIPVSRETERTPEKSEADTKKEPASNVAPEKTNDNSAAKPAIIDRLMSSGFQAVSGRKIDTIIIHSSYDAIGSDPYSVSGIISEYESYGVSAHYLIARGGTIYRLVEEKNIAYHAGASQVSDGRTNVNAFSIGIELMNTKDGEFTGDQYAALNKLLASLKDQYEIKYVLGHNQIAPGRKDDPWNLDWDKID